MWVYLAIYLSLPQFLYFFLHIFVRFHTRYILWPWFRSNYQQNWRETCSTNKDHPLSLFSYHPPSLPPSCPLSFSTSFSLLSLPPCDRILAKDRLGQGRKGQAPWSGDRDGQTVKKFSQVLDSWLSRPSVFGEGSSVLKDFSFGGVWAKGYLVTQLKGLKGFYR